MKKKIFTLLMLGFFPLSILATENYVPAIDNTAHIIVKEFEGYTLQVHTNKVLDTNTSQGSKAIYGKINNKSTNALLKVNSQYANGDLFIIKVFKNNKIVGMSKAFTLNGAYTQFNSLLTNKFKAFLLIIQNRNIQLINQNILAEE